MWQMPSGLISPPAAINAMDIEKEAEQVWPVWIDWDKRIVSFQEVMAFEKREFSSREEMFRFAVERTMEGFAIQ